MAKKSFTKSAPAADFTFFDKVPPHSIEAEMSLLGAMMLDRHAVGDSLLLAKPDDFYVPANRRICQVLMELYDHNVAIDLVTTLDKLKEHGAVEEIGGTAYLAQLADSVPSAANAEHYAHIVRNKSILRTLINTLGEVLREAFEEAQNIEQFLDGAEQKLFSVTERRSTGQAQGLRDVLIRTFEHLEKATTGMTGVPTGYYELDSLTGGFQKGEMIVLAARPSVGKTAFALNIIEHMVVREKQPVAFFSLEMGSREVAQRMLSSYAGVNLARFRGNLSVEDHEKLQVAAGDLSQAPLFIDDSPGMSIFDIRTKSRRLKAQHNIQMVAIDYLQLLNAAGAENRQVMVADMSRGVKALARELDIPVLCLCQLNRDVEQSNRHPRLSDIRESGAIEQDADVVMLLHREDRNSSDPAVKGEALLIVGKQRNGPTGKVDLQFQDTYARFVNKSRDFANA